MKKFRYDTSQFDLVDVVERIFEIDNLDQLHIQQVGPNRIPSEPSKDQSTSFHKRFYKTFDEDGSEFLGIYKSLAKHIAEEHYNGLDMVYQAKPTFRVQVPDNIAVAKWHKDKLYNHSEYELNVFLPLTQAFDTNTIWAESEEDKGDYSPMNASVGEYYIWDGANLSHGNQKNITGNDVNVITLLTRASMILTMREQA